MPALLALLTALFDDGISAVCIEGSLASWLSALETPFLHLVHDSIVPGTLTAGDVADLLAALAPRPVRGRGFIDALNRPLTEAELSSSLSSPIEAYGLVGEVLDISEERTDDRGRSDARWLIQNSSGE